MTPNEKLSQKQLDVGQCSRKFKRGNNLAGVPSGTVVPEAELSQLPLSPPFRGERVLGQ